MVLCCVAAACSNDAETGQATATDAPTARRAPVPTATAPPSRPPASVERFRVEPRLDVDQTAYPRLSFVAGDIDGRILVGAQGDVPCGDWTMDASASRNAIDVKRFTGPPKNANCYGTPRSLWKPVPVPLGDTAIALTYRRARATYVVHVRDGAVSITSTSGNGVARVPGRWWVVPRDFLYAAAVDSAGTTGTAALGCARVDELVRERGGVRFRTPDGLPLPWLASPSEAPGTRAEAAAKMLSRAPSRGCHATFRLRATDTELQVIARDASCDSGVIVRLMRRIPDGPGVRFDPADCEPERDGPLGLG